MNRAVSIYSALLVAMVSLVAAPAQAQAANSPSACAISSEDYAVYSAVLQNRGQPEDPEERWDNKPEVLIADTTETAQDAGSNMWGFRSSSKQVPGKETIANFNEHRSSTCSLQKNFDPAITYSLLSKDELDGNFKKKGPAGWSAFYKKHPKASGYLSFSSVGYSSSGTEALVYLGHYCGGLCGTGHLILLAKENGQWVVKNRLMMWIS